MIARTSLLLLAMVSAAMMSMASVSTASAQPPPSMARLDTEIGDAIRRLGLRSARVELTASWPSVSPRAAALEDRLREVCAAHLRGASDERVLRVEARALGGHLDLTLTTTADGWLRFRRWLMRSDADTVRIRVPLDAELRTFVAAHPALTASSIFARTYPLPDRDYLDLATIDLDGRDAPELVLLRADEVQVVRLATTESGRRRLQLVARVPIPEGDAPGVGTRRAIGTLALSGDGLVGRVRHRLAPFRIDWSGDAYRVRFLDDDPCPQSAHPLADACAMPVDGRDYFASELLSRVGSPPPERASTSFYQRQAGWVRRPDGSADFVEVVVTPRGRLVTRSGSDAVGLAGYGAGVGLADVDADGNAELIAASASLVGQGDQLTVLRVMRNGALRRVWQSEPIRGSVLVGGQGDLDGDSMPELYAIEEREGRAHLWVVR